MSTLTPLRVTRSAPFWSRMRSPGLRFAFSPFRPFRQSAPAYSVALAVPRRASLSAAVNAGSLVGRAARSFARLARRPAGSSSRFVGTRARLCSAIGGHVDAVCCAGLVAGRARRLRGRRRQGGWRSARAGCAWARRAHPIADARELAPTRRTARLLLHVWQLRAAVQLRQLHGRSDAAV